MASTHEENAGAWVEPGTLARAQAQGMKVERYLDRNDAYGFFQPLGASGDRPDPYQCERFRALLIL